MPLVHKHIALTLADIANAESMSKLHDVVADLTIELGFTYFVLSHHAHPSQWAEMKIALHNCPPEWVRFYAEKKVYRNDPILAACTKSAAGFTWDALPSMIHMTDDRARVLRLYRETGIGSGVTIPAHIPGEPSGSCTFATTIDQPFPVESVIHAQLLGAFAFQSARRLAGLITTGDSQQQSLTPRQRDCLLWAMRGKTDWEIAKILGLSPSTVSQHLDMARQRYGVTKRVQLALRAIQYGDILLDDAY